jgi:hypothetical protein
VKNFPAFYNLFVMIEQKLHGVKITSAEKDAGCGVFTVSLYTVTMQGDFIIGLATPHLIEHNWQYSPGLYTAIPKRHLP